MSERYEDMLRARDAWWPVGAGPKHPYIDVTFAERDALADAVEALRWIAKHAADERARFTASNALARLDSFVSSPTTETPTTNLRNTSVSKKTTGEAA